VRWPRRRSQDDFDAEIQAHLAHEADQLVAEGLTPRTARDAARRAFGNPTRVAERYHQSRRTAGLERLGRDARHALRGLRRSPGFTAAAVATLALGLGVNTAIFTLLYALAFRPLPVGDPDRVVSVYQDVNSTLASYGRRVEGSPYLLSQPEYEHYRGQTRSLSGLAAFADVDLSLGGGGGAPVRGAVATCDYFQVLRVPIALGRAFAADECARGSAVPVAVVSDAFWRRQLAADPAALGTPIVLGRQLVTVIGIAAPGFTGTTLRPSDVWLPITLYSVFSPGNAFLGAEDVSWLAVVGRMRDGVTLADVRRDLRAAAARRDAERPGLSTTPIVNGGALMSGPEERNVGKYIAGLVLVLAALVVAMACANVMSLVLARGAARGREIGIRLSLGATRGRLMAQLMIESLVLAAFGAAGAMLLATWIPPVVVAAMPGAPVSIDLTPDIAVFSYAAALAAASALLFGLLPARHATRVEPAAVLKGDGGALARVRASKLRNAIVGTQVAGSVLLLVVAALLARGIRHAQTIDLGFEPRGVVAIALGTREAGYDTLRTAALHRRLRERFAGLPGVQSVAVVGVLPLLARMVTPIALPRSGAAPDSANAETNVVSASYFATMRVPIVRGRTVADRDLPGAPRAAVINTALAARFWPGRDPLGQRFTAGSETLEVVGLTPAAHNVSLSRPDGPFFYTAASASNPTGLTILVRARGDVPATAAMLRQLVRTIDPDVVVRVDRLEDVVAETLRPSRMITVACLALGVLAALVAIIGVYGVVSYAVAQRTQEIGVRMALGASRRSILTLVARDGLRAVAFGSAAGVLLAAGVSWAIREVLYGVSPLDPIAFAGTAALVLVAAAAGMYRPAARAARVDPATALRND
jgi:putative ABC transport system permease protein